MSYNCVDLHALTWFECPYGASVQSRKELPFVITASKDLSAQLAFAGVAATYSGPDDTSIN